MRGHEDQWLPGRELVEGADVMISDHHERRLGETRDELAALGLGRVESVVCDVTSTAQVDALSGNARFSDVPVTVRPATCILARSMRWTPPATGNSNRKSCSPTVM